MDRHREKRRNEGLFRFRRDGKLVRDCVPRQKKRRGRKMKNSKGLILYFPVACLFGQMCNFAHERCLRATIYWIKLYIEGGMIHLCFRIFNFHFCDQFRIVQFGTLEKKKKRNVARERYIYKENNKRFPPSF